MQFQAPNLAVTFEKRGTLLRLESHDRITPCQFRRPVSCAKQRKRLTHQQIVDARHGLDISRIIEQPPCHSAPDQRLTQAESITFDVVNVHLRAAKQRRNPQERGDNGHDDLEVLRLFHLGSSRGLPQ